MKGSPRCQHCSSRYKSVDWLPWSARGFCSPSCFFQSRGEPQLSYVGPLQGVIKQGIARYEAQTGRNDIQFFAVHGLLFPSDSLGNNLDFLTIALQTAEIAHSKLLALELSLTCLSTWVPALVCPEEMSSIRRLQHPRARFLALRDSTISCLALMEGQSDPHRLILIQALQEIETPEFLEPIAPSHDTAKVSQAG